MFIYLGLIALICFFLGAIVGFILKINKDSACSIIIGGLFGLFFIPFCFAVLGLLFIYGFLWICIQFGFEFEEIRDDLRSIIKNIFKKMFAAFMEHKDESREYNENLSTPPQVLEKYSLERIYIPKKQNLNGSPNVLDTSETLTNIEKNGDITDQNEDFFDFEQRKNTQTAEIENNESSLPKDAYSKQAQKRRRFRKLNYRDTFRSGRK